MKLLHKTDMCPYHIYDITYDPNGFPQFLIFRRGQWNRISAKHFTPDFCEDGTGGYICF